MIVILDYFYAMIVILNLSMLRVSDGVTAPLIIRCHHIKPIASNHPTFAFALPSLQQWRQPNIMFPYMSSCKKLRCEQPNGRHKMAFGVALPQQALS